MKTLKHSNGRVTARKPDGQFREWTGDDFGIGVCPQCGTITTQPEKPKELETGMIDPFLFNRWRKARVCRCGWQNEDAKQLRPAPPAGQ